MFAVRSRFFDPLRSFGSEFSITRVDPKWTILMPGALSLSSVSINRAQATQVGNISLALDTYAS
jgi:hypothetical protein